MGKKQETAEELRARASEYGIVNADQMNDKQLRSEIKAIDDQPKTAEKADSGVPSNVQPAPAQNTTGSVPETPASADTDAEGQGLQTEGSEKAGNAGAEEAASNDDPNPSNSPDTSKGSTRGNQSRSRSSSGRSRSRSNR